MKRNVLARVPRRDGISEMVTIPNKGEWGPGPWIAEPDRMIWTDEETGLWCAAVRSTHVGMWCGYVGVTWGNPVFGIDYADLDMNVHGGLTFAGRLGAVDPSRWRWWVGFDCGHYGDAMPALTAVTGVLASAEAYRTKEYVIDEVTSLAWQIKHFTWGQRLGAWGRRLAWRLTP